MRQLYEIDDPDEDLSQGIPPTCPVLWRYRAQVTVEHLARTFQEVVASNDPSKCRVLAEFLHKVRVILKQSCFIECENLNQVKCYASWDFFRRRQFSLEFLMDPNCNWWRVCVFSVLLIKKWSMLSVRLSSYGCAREAGRAREKRLSGTGRSWVLLLLLEWSSIFPSACTTRETHS